MFISSSFLVMSFTDASSTRLFLFPEKENKLGFTNKLKLLKGVGS